MCNFYIIFSFNLYRILSFPSSFSLITILHFRNFLLLFYLLLEVNFYNFSAMSLSLSTHISLFSSLSSSFSSLLLLSISVIELDRASVYRYPGNYARYLEMKEARIAADDADADRAKTKLRRESLWMAKQPRCVYNNRTCVQYMHAHRTYRTNIQYTHTNEGLGGFRT